MCNMSMHHINTCNKRLIGHITHLNTLDKWKANFSSVLISGLIPPLANQTESTLTEYASIFWLISGFRKILKFFFLDISSSSAIYLVKMLNPLATLTSSHWGSCQKSKSINQSNCRQQKYCIFAEVNKYPVVLNLTSDVTLYWMLVDVNVARMRVDLTSNFNNITSYPREDGFLKFESTIH